MAEMLPEYKEFLDRYESEKKANPDKIEEIDKKFAQENSDYFAVAQKSDYDKRVLRQFHDQYYGTPEQKNLKDVLAGKEEDQWTPEEKSVKNLVDKYGLTPNDAQDTRFDSLERDDYTDKAKKELYFSVNAEMKGMDPDAAPLSMDDIVQKDEAALNDPAYTDPVNGYVARFVRALDEAEKNGTDLDEVNATFFKENQDFFVAKKKLDFDGIVLNQAANEYYNDVPAVPGQRGAIEGKDEADLTPDEKRLKEMVDKYGLEEDPDKRTNDEPVDLNDYPEEERDEYAARMNLVCSHYVPNFQPKTTGEYSNIADLAEGRSNTADNGRQDENQEEIDLLKEADEMKRWLDLYEKEGKADPDFKMPYSRITGISSSKPNEPNSPVDISLESGTTLQTRQSNISMKHKSQEPSLEDCMTMVRLGQKRGWTVANLKGSENFKKQMFLACTLLGMEVKGYTPTPELKQQAQDMLQAQQDAKAKGVPTYREKAQDLDARTVNGGYVPPAPQHQQQQQQADTQQPSEFSPADKKKAPLVFEAVDKEEERALRGVMDELKKAEKAANAEATLEQRKRIRAQIQEAARKEAAGEPLTPEDDKAKKLAAKYQVALDPKDDPKKIPQINVADLDKDVAKKRADQHMDARMDAFIGASLVQEGAAMHRQSVMDGKVQLDAPVPDLAAQMTTRRNDMKAQGMPKSDLIKQVGDIRHSAKMADVNAAQLYSQRVGQTAQRTVDPRLQQQVANVVKRAQTGR